MRKINLMPDSQRSFRTLRNDFGEISVDLAKLAANYESDLMDILNATDQKNISSEQLQNAYQTISGIKESLTKQEHIEMRRTKLVSAYIDYLENLLKLNESFYYQKKYFCQSPLERTAFFIRHPELTKADSKFKENLSSILDLAIDVAVKVPLPQLRILDTFERDKETNLPTILSIFSTITEKLVSLYVDEVSKTISDYHKTEIIRIAKENFPKVGNNKALLFERPQYKKDLDTKFLAHINSVFDDYIRNYISYNINGYSKFSSAFYDFLIITASTIKKSTIYDSYIDFAQDYTNKVFAKTQGNKVDPTTNTNKYKDTERLNTMINRVLPKKTISQTIISGVDKFLANIDAEGDDKITIKELLFRRYRTQKEVRLCDIQKILGKELNINKQDIDELENLGFIIHTPIVCEAEPIKTTANEITTKTEPLDKVESTPEKSMIEDDLENLEDRLLGLFENHKYTIGNEKRLIKQIDTLYKSPTQKLQLLNYLHLNIGNVEDKRPLNYKVIDLKAGYRVLIVDETVIDGIYTHDDYVKRLKSILQ